jgi:benzil reductase ((S)-benzoin forming)
MVSRSIILTGASRGLGAALFDALHNDGARLFAMARTFTPGQSRAAEDDPKAVVLRGTDLRDVGQYPSADEFCDFVEACGDDDEVVLLHNAATIEPIGLVGTLSSVDLAAAVQVNLVAPMALTNTFLAAMPARLGHVRIVYITSAAAHKRYPGWAAYCATKAGAETFMRTVGKAAIRPCTVDIVDPGAMETSMQRAIRDRGLGLPGHDKLVERHQRGQIPDPVSVVAWIMDRHFGPEPAPPIS